MQVGLVVHPRRDIDVALVAIREWASENGVRLGQIRIAGQSRHVEDPVDAASCDVVFALGGDGTALAALHAAAPVSRPALGVACGSIGVLTSVSADRLPAVLERLTAGNWTTRPVPALEVAIADGETRHAINDFAVIRDGTGQLITQVEVDGELYVRTAGDGLVVATTLGSSAYTMAAGGPILMPGAKGIVVTPLAPHGGVSPPLVAGPDSRLRLVLAPGYGGGRFEVDGQQVPMPAGEVTIRLRPEYASLVELAGQESMLAGLRRRGLVVDSPRILARDIRAKLTGEGEGARPEDRR
jgi:NAD+ kinase